jgi:hypothetical protein
MKEITLTRCHVAIVDDADYDWLVHRYTWSSAGARKIYAATKSRLTGKIVLMHRLITGAISGEVVDHVDRNTLNNTRKNIRLCTAAENAWNRMPLRGYVNGVEFRGVRFCARKNVWRVRIVANRKGVDLTFASAIEAAIKYDELALTMHGEFAITNKSLGLL